jgi:hypothetical protein
VNVLLVFVAFVVLVGRAVDVEQASGRVPEQAPAVRISGGTSVTRPYRVAALPDSSWSQRSRSIAAVRLVFGARSADAIAVVRCETGGTFDPHAIGSQGERGIFQIHPVHFAWAQPRRLFDPVWNARVAYRLSSGGRDWHAWTCKP